MANSGDLLDILERVATGTLAPEEARQQLRKCGDPGESAQFDGAQATRTRVPSFIDAEQKTIAEVMAFGLELVSETGQVIIKSPNEEARAELEETVADTQWYDRSQTLVLQDSEFESSATEGRVAVTSAGTSDIPVAESAVVVAEAMGSEVETWYDIGVSNINRVLSVVEELRKCDVVVVAAGREGALATVVAGLVDIPVIGLPVDTGSGMGGDGEAALLGMLQSCTCLTTVNVNAGYIAGAQASLIAR